MNNVRVTEIRTPHKAKRHPWGYRPLLEILEGRLPPGDAVRGMLLAWPEARPEMHESKHELVTTLDFDECETPAIVTSRSRAHTEDQPTTAILSLPTDESIDLREAGLIPAVYSAGINPPARSAAVLNAGGMTNSTPFAVADHARNSNGFSGGPVTAPLMALRAVMHAVPTIKNGTASENESRLKENYGSPPLTFEANKGQTDSRVDFIARTGGATMFLTSTAAVFSIQKPGSNQDRQVAGVNTLDAPCRLQGVDTHQSPETRGVALHMQIVGANPSATPIGEAMQPGIVNYFIGNDPTQWHANIPTFGRVEYQDVYPGIDLAYYGNNRQMEYDFIVSPGADPNQVSLNFAGADGVEINPHGDLILHTAVGDVVQRKPYTYQASGAAPHEVSSRYVVDGTQVRFEIGAYDPSRPLVIDPLVLGYSTFLGGSGSDPGYGIAVDGSGNTYVTGDTGSSDFPANPGAFDSVLDGESDVFVAKLRADGAGLLYSTFLGGSNWDEGKGIAVDVGGNAYVTGQTGSSNFPTTPGAYDTGSSTFDAFVTKLSPTGSALAYSTLLGGSLGDAAYGIAVDSSGNAYITGETASSNFPTTPGALDTTHNGGTYDAFATKLNPTGSALVYSTFLGGADGDYAASIAVDGGGNAYVTGNTHSSDFPATLGAFDVTYNSDPEEGPDGFVTKLNATGSTLDYSTFLGGDSIGYGIAVDSGGNAYVTGETASIGFPTTTGAFDTTKNDGNDAFVTKLSADGSALVYSTFLGGSNSDRGHGIAIDGTGNAYVTGRTNSNDFPSTPDAVKRRNRGTFDAFVTKLNASGSALVYSTYLGGGGSDDSGNGIAVDGSSNVYVTGYTRSTAFPTTPGVFDPTYNGGTYDAFVTKFAEA